MTANAYPFGVGRLPADSINATLATALAFSRRVGCSLRRAATQSIPTAGATQISWDTEDFDSDGFTVVPTSTITVPAGLAGIYTITYEGVATVAPTGACFQQLVFTTRALAGTAPIYRTYTPTGELYGLLSVSIRLAAGDAFNVQILHNTGAARNYNASLQMYRTAL